MIHELLATGKENARTGRELAQQLGCDIRSVTAQIEKERREGNPICATATGHTGYYLAANAEELNAYCDAVKRRAIELFKTRQALISVLKQLPGVNNSKGNSEKQSN